MKIKIIIVLFVLFTGCLYYYVVVNSPKKDDLLLNKIDNIEKKIDSVSLKKDSIKTVIITVEKEIINNEKHYEKVVNDIVHQSSIDDSIFATQYIQKFIDERLY